MVCNLPPALGTTKSTSVTLIPLGLALPFVIHIRHRLSAEQTWPGAWDKCIVYSPHLIMWPGCDWCPVVDTGDSLAYEVLRKQTVLDYWCNAFPCLFSSDRVTWPALTQLPIKIADDGETIHATGIWFRGQAMLSQSFEAHIYRI